MGKNSLCCQSLHVGSQNSLCNRSRVVDQTYRWKLTVQRHCKPFFDLNYFLTTYLLQLNDCENDEMFCSTLMSDEAFHILEKIGYRGVPLRETLSS